MYKGFKLCNFYSVHVSHQFSSNWTRFEYYEIYYRSYIPDCTLKNLFLATSLCERCWGLLSLLCPFFHFFLALPLWRTRCFILFSLHTLVFVRFTFNVTSCKTRWSSSPLLRFRLWFERFPINWNWKLLFLTIYTFQSLLVHRER